ncbi:MAG: lyase family protein [Thaumarchaeota archaeon]|nr:lyase family protein [Nitrososphaerota archaeon]
MKETSEEKLEGSSPRYSELFSPTDYRYSVPDLLPFLSEDAYVKYKGKVEAALARQLAKRGICSKKVSNEIEKAVEGISAEEVYAEERRIKHDVRALVNVIRSKISDEAKPFVHLTATSYDIVDTANALRIKDAISRVVIPDLIKLENALIELTLKYSKTTQIGRTHGQHAEPITLGFFTSFYVSRLGQRIEKISSAIEDLSGKFAGAVGVYGPLSLMVDDPEQFESDLLDSLGLKPSEVSTQIVQPEPMTDLLHSIVSTFGVIANFARDARHLQRTEISEISEEFSPDQVGSSTMPQKRNPINFENVESMWKKFMPQMITVYMDQISEHQRDLTNSLSQRYVPELIVAFDYAVRRLTRTIWNEKSRKPRLLVDLEMLDKNLKMSSDKILSEPLYILLSIAGHPDAHETVRKIVQESIRSKKSFLEVIKSNGDLSQYLDRIPKSYLKVIDDPANYRGIAVEKSIKIAESWKKKLSKFQSNHPV